MIKRSNVQGGKSTIYNNAGQPLQTVTLFEPLDSIIVNDTRILHGVSEIQPQENGLDSFRDMLLFDFNPVAWLCTMLLNLELESKNPYSKKVVLITPYKCVF